MQENPPKRRYSDEIEIKKKRVRSGHLKYFRCRRSGTEFFRFPVTVSRLTELKNLVNSRLFKIISYTENCVINLTPAARICFINVFFARIRSQAREVSGKNQTLKSAAKIVVSVNGINLKINVVYEKVFFVNVK